MGGKSGGGGSETTTTVVPKSMQTTLPDWMQAPMQNAFGNIAGMNPQVPYNQQMLGAAQGGINAGYDTSGVIDPAMQQWQSVVGGDQMSADVIGQAAQPYIDNFMPQLTSGFAQAGRAGSGAHNYAAGQGIGNIVAQQYQQNADRQQQALGLAPGMNALRMSPYSNAYDYGSRLRGEGLEARDAQYGQLNQLGNIAQMMRGQDSEDTVVTESGGGSSGGGLGGLLGGVAGSFLPFPGGSALGAGLGNYLFSGGA